MDHVSIDRQPFVLAKASSESFRHPSAFSEDVDENEDGETDQESLHAFKELLLFCIPAPGANRPMMACYRRLCITAFITSPELFVGLTARELASSIGLSYGRMRNEMSLIRSMLAQRARGISRNHKTPTLRRIT